MPHVVADRAHHLCPINPEENRLGENWTAQVQMITLTLIMNRGYDSAMPVLKTLLIR